MSYTYEQLLESIRLKNEIQVEGLNFNPHIFDNSGVGNDVAERVNALFTCDRHAHKKIEFPALFYLPVGNFRVHIRWNLGSHFVLVKEDGVFNIVKDGKRVVENIRFAKRADYYSKKTSDGADMRTIAQDYGYGNIFIVYSNECCLKEKGQDCLFCNINATKDLYGEDQNINWKNVTEIAETVQECYGNGYNHLTVSGGFVPERREVDYYADIAEAIQDKLGVEDFNGTACVGAPEDLSVIEKYKEAGFSSIATNIEIWDEKMFEVICPGKSQMCGGRKNWIATLDRELEVFGKFHVRSTLVSGIEPKESLIEGIDTLVSKGICALPSQWYVNVGSALEGHRTPDPDWHWDVFEKTKAIYQRNGLDFWTLRNATAEPDTIIHDLLRLDEGIELVE